MAELCTYFIESCVSADCENPIYAGMAPVGYLANFDQIASVTYDTTNGNLITGFTMGTTTGTNPTSYCWYKVQQLGRQPFEGTQVEMSESTYGNKWTHTVQIVISDHGPKISHDILDRLANGRFVFIGQNDYVHQTDATAGTVQGDNKYEVMGVKKGLRATAITREAYGDNDGAWIVTLTEENGPQSANFFFTTDESTTDAALAALACTC